MGTVTNGRAVESSDRLERLLEEYLAAVEAGTAPPAEEFAARHPELAGELNACLVSLEFLRRAAPRQGPREAGRDEPSAEAGASGTLGDYRLLREVGRGGMGVVYEAEQISLGRRVALKVLPFAATMDPRQLQRFQNEARAAASLEHPNIVPVYGVGQERGVHFYAMKFIDGQTLAELIARRRPDGSRPGPTDPTAVDAGPAPAADTTPALPARTEPVPADAALCRRAAEWAAQAAEALEHAHAAGVVHRDVKPANLMVDAQGKVWVADFGLARTGLDAGLTLTGDLLGTLRYMSPEQALARHGLMDHRTDIYSLGVSLYELLTGRPAFPGDDREEVLRRIASEEPAAPRRLDRAIPLELETVVLKAMRKEPAERYATGRELADDLGRFLKDEPIRARRPTLAQRVRRWARRRQALVWSAGVAAVLTLAGLAAAAGWLIHDDAGRRAETERVVGAALAESETLQREGKLPEALSAARLARGMVEGGTAGEALRRRVRGRVTDLELVERLDEIRLQVADLVKGEGFDRGHGDAEYGRAFREFGLDVESQTATEAAQRIKATTVPLELVTVLDRWARWRQALRGETDQSWRHLTAVARAADPDASRNLWRDAWERGDKQALRDLATSARVSQLAPSTVDLCGQILGDNGATDLAVQFHREAQRSYLNDFWVNESLGLALYQLGPSHSEESVRSLAIACALRPRSSGAHCNLGGALLKKGDVDGAIAAFQEALRLKKDFPQAHYNLGAALLKKGEVDRAIAAFQEALRLKKDFPLAHNELGVALLKKGNVDGAIAAFQEAARLKKDFPQAHYNLGGALLEKGDVDGAIAALQEVLRLDKNHANAHCSLGAALLKKGDMDRAIAAFQEVLRLNKNHTTAHCNLGGALLEKGDVDGAIAAFRRAIQTNEEFAEAHCNLGSCLKRKGQFREALAAHQRGHELGTKRTSWAHPSQKWVQESRRLVELDEKLPDVLSGKERPVRPLELLEYGQLCSRYKGRFVSAARLYREGLTAQPDLAANPLNGNRYSAACAAALAAAGRGEEAAGLTEAERAVWRRQALDWLRSDLTLWDRALDGQTPPRAVALEQLRHWKQGPGLAGLRDADGLAGLPENERQEWRQFWADVSRTLARAGENPAPQKPEKLP